MSKLFRLVVVLLTVVITIGLSYLQSTRDVHNGRILHTYKADSTYTYVIALRNGSVMCVDSEDSLLVYSYVTVKEKLLSSECDIIVLGDENVR